MCSRFFAHGLVLALTIVIPYGVVLGSSTPNPEREECLDECDNEYDFDVTLCEDMYEFALDNCDDAREADETNCDVTYAALALSCAGNAACLANVYLSYLDCLDGAEDRQDSCYDAAVANYTNCLAVAADESDDCYDNCFQTTAIIQNVPAFMQAPKGIDWSEFWI